MQEKVEPAYTKGKVAFAKFRKGVSFKTLKTRIHYIYLFIIKNNYRQKVFKNNDIWKSLKIRPIRFC